MNTKRYSRLASVEEKKNIKRAVSYVVLSIVTLIILVIFGLPLLIKFAGFIGNIGDSNNPVTIDDMTPPAPPQFDNIPEFTNQENLEITGMSENGARITIRANNDESEVVANSDGRFNFTFNLSDGENAIDAIATDTGGNVSTQTKTYNIVYDNTDPELTVESPSDNSSYYGAGQRQLTIKGNVNESVDLTINDRFVSVNEDGNFTFTTTLSEGENKFEVKAVDPAGNTSSTSLTTNFSL
jgi:hypothetical protein